MSVALAGAVRSGAAHHLASIANPYPGLRPFRRSEEAIFFGRDRMIDDVIDRVAENRLVLVHGASGCGKSSLIRAGVLARFRRMHALRDIHWHTGAMRPGSSPMWHFAAALIEALHPETEREPDIQLIRRVRLQLNQGLIGLVEALGSLGLGPGDRLCLLVDQFEELFAYASDGGGEEAAQFVRLLLQVRTPPPGEARVENVGIVLTMRSDYLGDCIRFEGLAEAVNATQYLVVPMDHEELVDAICQPAMLPEFGGMVDDDVIEALIRDTRHDPDQLPLIQHALAYLWRRARAANPDARVRLTLADVRDEAVQSASHALSNHAGEALAELEAGDPGLRQVTEHVFRALTETDAGGRAIRRRLSKPEICAEVGAGEDEIDAVIEAFARKERSFLYVEEHADPSRPPIVDITHEALIRHWRRLSDRGLDGNGQPIGWVRREAADRRAWLTLVDTARGLERGREVFLAKDVYEDRKQWWDWVRPSRAWAERHGGGFDLVTRLFVASERKIADDARLDRDRRAADEKARRAEIEAQVAEQQAAKERRLRGRTIWLAVGAVVLAAIGSFFGWQAHEQRQAAERQATLARVQAGAAETQRTAADKARYQADQARLRAEEERAVARASLTRALEKDTLLRTSLAGQQLAAGWPGAALRLALSALPEGAEDPRAYLPEAGQTLVRAIARTPTADFVGDGAINAIAFGPGGERLVTGGQDGTARLFDTATGAQVAILEGDGYPVRAVASSPDGSAIAAGADDGTLWLWDATTGELLFALQDHEAAIDAVAFSPDGGRILTGSWDRTAHLLDAATGGLILVLEGHGDWLRSVAFSPDGTRIATGSDDGTARLWDARSGEPLRVFVGHARYVLAVAFGPGGDRLLTGSRDGTIRLWDVATGEPLEVLWGHQDWVTSVAWSTDGRQILTGSRDGTARLWNVETGALTMGIDGHDGAVWSVAFQPGGDRVVTAGTFDGARIWSIDPVPSRPIVSLPDQSVAIHRAVPSPDGARLLTGGDDGARLWEAASGRPLGVLHGHDGAVYGVAFGADGARLLTGGEDATARLWDAETGDLLDAFEGHAGAVTSVAFGPEGRRILTASADGTARLWDIMTGQQMVVFEGHRDSVHGVSFGADGDSIVTASNDGTVGIWDAATGDVRRRFTTEATEAVAAYAALIDPSGQRLAASFADGWVRVWSLDSEGEVPDASFRISDPAGDLGLVWADDRVLYTTGFDGAVRAFDVVTRRPIGYERLPVEGLHRPAILPTDGSILVPTAEGRVYVVPAMVDRTWQTVLAHAIDLAGARDPTSGDIRRIELLRALKETGTVTSQR